MSWEQAWLKADTLGDNLNDGKPWEDVTTVRSKPGIIGGTHGADRTVWTARSLNAGVDS